MRCPLFWTFLFLRVHFSGYNSDYTPVLYCGTQLVHGINHMIICKMKVCHPDATEKLAKVIINEVPKTELESLWSIVTIQDIT